MNQGKYKLSHRSWLSPAQKCSCCMIIRKRMLGQLQDPKHTCRQRQISCSRCRYPAGCTSCRALSSCCEPCCCAISCFTCTHMHGDMYERKQQVYKLACTAKPEHLARHSPLGAWSNHAAAEPEQHILSFLLFQGDLPAEHPVDQQYKWAYSTSC